MLHKITRYFIRSPNNNPIETIFGILKLNFKKDYNEKKKNEYIVIKNKYRRIFIKKIIKDTIEKFNKDYNTAMIENFFNHCIKYDYKDLEKELRDRIIIREKK